MMKSRKLAAFLMAGVCALPALRNAAAADVLKANNTTQLQLPGSWALNTLPTSADVAVWNSTVTGPNSSLLGGALDVQGIRIGDPGGVVSITRNASAALTLGSAGITVNGADLNFSGNGLFVTPAPITLSAAQTWSIASGRTLSLGSQWSNIGGSHALEITGAGSLVLAAGDNSAPRTYSFGTGALTLGGGLRLANGSTAIHQQTITNATFLNGNITLQSNSATGTGYGAIRFDGGLDIGSANRTITLAAVNTTTRSPASFFSSIFTITTPAGITGSGTLRFENENAAANKAASVLIDGSGSLGVANLVVGDNVHVVFRQAGTIGAGTALTLEAGSSLGLIAGDVGSATATRTIKSLSGNGLVTNYSTVGGHVVTLEIDGGTDTGTTTFSGDIRQGAAGGVWIDKKGTTTQIFAGSNDYLGSTTVNAGTLLVNGAHIQSANGLGYAVNAGGTLGGTGRIARFSTGNNQIAVDVASGGTLAPGGDGVLGSLTLDGQNLTGINARHLRMQSGADFHFSLAGDGSGADALDFWNYVSGDLVLNSNEIHFSLLGPLAAGTYTVDLLRFYSDGGVNLTTGITTGLVLGSLGAGIEDASLIYNSAGGLVQLQYTVIPEPSAAVLFGLGALGFGLLRRRRKV